MWDHSARPRSRRGEATRAWPSKAGGRNSPQRVIQLAAGDYGANSGTSEVVGSPVDFELPQHHNCRLARRCAMKYSGWLLSVALATGCSTTEANDPAPKKTQNSTTEAKDSAAEKTQELAIGAACTSADGWQQKAITCPPLDGPTACPPPANYVERHQLPPRVRYCVESPLYPDGYFTSNCSADVDCPVESFCDGQNCRASCVTDDECRSPSHCVSLGAPRPFCQAPQNLPRM